MTALLILGIWATILASIASPTVSRCLSQGLLEYRGCREAVGPGRRAWPRPWQGASVDDATRCCAVRETPQLPRVLLGASGRLSSVLVLPRAALEVYQVTVIASVLKAFLNQEILVKAVLTTTVLK